MNLSRSEKLALAAQCISSTRSTAEICFPFRFKVPFAPLHSEVFDALDDPYCKKLLIEAPRGFGKTSIVQLAFPAKEIAARNANFIIQLSCTSHQATTHSENLKRELAQNPRYVSLFGSMESESWAKDVWIANNVSTSCPNGTMVLPRSYGQQVRGLLNGNYRPDRFIVDDFEDAESVHSEDQRAKRKEYFFADVMGSVEVNDPYRFIVVGTLLHDDSLLANLAADSSWRYIHLEICDENLRSNWPARFSDAQIAELFRNFSDQGLEDVFYREYRNLPFAPGTKPFSREMFQYHDPAQLNMRLLEHFIIIDPAKTSSPTSCDTAIICVGFSSVLQRFYVQDLVASKLHPDETAHTACEMALKWNAHYIGIEKTGSGEYATWPLENYIRTRGLPFQVMELNARRGPSQYIPAGSKRPGKDSRISAALVPLYRQGFISHNSKCEALQQLERQLLDYPTGRRIDIPDALSYCVGMANIGERFFATNFTITENTREDYGFLDGAKEDAALAKLYKEHACASHY